MLKTKIKLALIQLLVGNEKSINLKKTADFIKEAAVNGAQLVILPEYFNSPYGPGYFSKHSETFQGETTEMLSQAAQANQVHLIGGSLSEKRGGRLFNTCTVWGPLGTLLTVYRKMHLHDVNIPGILQFKESDVMSPGDALATFKLGQTCKVGIGLGHDIYFAEMAQLYAQQGCKLIVYPGNFESRLGLTHWSLLQRCRAIDNQVYVAGVSRARDHRFSYESWGHSTVVTPWGEVIATSNHEELIVYADIDMDYLEQVQKQLPLAEQRRSDVYHVMEMNQNKRE